MTDTREPDEKFDEKFNVRDYRRLPEGFPAELIEGDFVREPAPTWWHQRLLSRLAERLFAAAGVERVFLAPTDVFVDEHTVLQPDALVAQTGTVVRPETLEIAIPLLVVEVLSPATASRDRDRKKGLYLRAGVREVWLVDPDAGTVEVHTRGGVEIRRGSDRAASAALPGFTLAWSDLAG